MSVDKLSCLGWSPRIELEQGLRVTYDWYLSNESQLRK